MTKEEFIKLILDDSYIKWLSSFLEEYGEFDDCYFTHNGNNFLSDKEKYFIDYLSMLFDELNKYSFKNGLINKNTFSYNLKYNGKIYQIYWDLECYCCKLTEEDESITLIDYGKFKKLYKKK